jgi:hypothetical protein
MIATWSAWNILRETDHRSLVATAEHLLRWLERELGISLMMGEKI